MLISLEKVDNENLKKLIEKFLGLDDLAYLKLVLDYRLKKIIAPTKDNAPTIIKKYLDIAINIFSTFSNIKKKTSKYEKSTMLINMNNVNNIDC